MAKALARSLVIGSTAFLTLVDLFATQAILPSLAAAYDVGPAAMGLAVNAATLGMALGSLGVAFFSRRVERRLGVMLSLAALSIPTALLAVAPDLAVFSALRILQGIFMASAFALTLSYLAEQCSAAETAGAFAAYITGNVASNLVGRLMAAAAVDHLGLAGNFYLFSALNLAGAALVWASLARTAPAPMPGEISWRQHFANPRLRAAFAVGFLILFAFIGTFSYVNFVLVSEPLALGMMALGFVYFVFLPSIFTTPLAGRAVARFGVQPTMWVALGVAGAGLPLLLAESLVFVIAGLALVGVGTFFAQATATGFVGRAAIGDRGSASGLYLASYFLGGLAGAAVLGQLFDRIGWGACVTGIGVALAAAAWLAVRLQMPAPALEPAHAS
ncbi:MAG TPA: MFS transporter [Burkholderiales bacterium]|nr:MFS transporter [Burkholderiales bacterium]